MNNTKAILSYELLYDSPPCRCPGFKTIRGPLGFTRVPIWAFKGYVPPPEKPAKAVQSRARVILMQDGVRGVVPWYAIMHEQLEAAFPTTHVDVEAQIAENAEDDDEQK